MKLIELTQGYFAKVDDEDYKRVSQYSWCAEVRPNTIYAGSNLGQGRGGKRVRLHRFVMNNPEGQQIDHIDRDGLNCQKHNLRLADPRKNGINIHQPQTENGTGYRGVCHGHKGKFIARIRDNTGRKTHLGTFDTAIEAAKAYDEAAKLYHQDFAVLNFQVE